MGLNDRALCRRIACSFAALSFFVIVVHAVFYNISDIRSSTNHGNQSWILFITYHVFLNFPIIAAALFAQRSVARRQTEYGVMHTIDTLQRYLILFFAVAVVGILLHLNAKLRLIDGEFNGCWSSLRAAWLDQSNRSTMSEFERLESVLGHLLTSPMYIGLFVSTLLLVVKGFSWRNFFYFVIFSLIGFLYSLAIVSRSVMMLLMVIVILGCVAAYFLGQVGIFNWGKRTGVILGFFVGLSFLTVLGIFANSVQCSAQDPGEISAVNAKMYEEGYFDELPIGRELHPTAIQVFVRDICSTCNSAFIYLNHGFYNFSAVLNTQFRGEHVLLRFGSNWAKRLHLIDDAEPSVTKRAYGAGGVTLPGAAMHDFGIFGLIIVALAHGFLVLGACWFLTMKNLFGLFGLALYVATGASLIISGMFVAPSLLGFPFAMFSILIFGGMVLAIDSLIKAVSLRRMKHHE